MLTTGIDVEARPPGKKVKRLSLLSGGERSLVAVAFLVALFKARPSPFYILDEVEAALDDTNLGRLLEIYEELRDNSQLDRHHAPEAHHGGRRRALRRLDARRRRLGGHQPAAPRGRGGLEREPRLRTDFPAIRTITTRWEDEDVYGHVNNVVYYSFFDTAVNGYLIDATGVDIRKLDAYGIVAETQLPVPARAAASRATSTPGSRSPSSARRASSTRSACSRATTTSRPRSAASCTCTSPATTARSRRSPTSSAPSSSPSPDAAQLCARRCRG